MTLLGEETAGKDAAGAADEIGGKGARPGRQRQPVQVLQDRCGEVLDRPESRGDQEKKREAQPDRPQASYGTQKAIGELLVYDMTRKGYVDGRSLRLPTVTVRPGKPNKAASSFASGIVREPLAGVDAPCPVAPTTRMWVTSPRTVIDNIVVGHEAPAAAFGHTRSVNVPGLCIAVGDMVAALRAIAGDAVADRVKWQYDPAVDRIVSTWPANFAPALGRRLGMRADADFAGIVRAFMADDMPRA